MTQKGYVPNPMRLAFFAALLSSSAIATAQEMQDMTPVPAPQDVPAPAQPIIVPEAQKQQVPTPVLSNPTDSIAPSAREALDAAEKKTAVSPTNGQGPRRTNPSVQRAAAPAEPAIKNELSAPLPVAVNVPADNIAADGTIAAEPIVAEPVVAEASGADNSNSAENWLLALAGLGILGIAGGAGVAMTRRRRPVNTNNPVVSERMDRRVDNQSPIVTNPAQIEVTEPNNVAREYFVNRPPAQPHTVKRADQTPVSNIPIVDPLFAAKTDLPPITDPLFANHPDYVGNKPSFKGFDLNTSTSWSEPRRVEPAPKVDHLVN